MNNLQLNLERIRELTETVVPFHDTLSGNGKMISADKDKTCVLKSIHKEVDFAILVADVEEGFIHSNHYHEECEIICMLSGEMIVKLDDAEIILESNKPVVLPPNKSHEVHYLKPTKILAITIPASKDFPT
jgi:quercetin dioxygenase-like cupin family protein